MSGNLKAFALALASAYHTGIGDEAARRMRDFEAAAPGIAHATALLGVIDHDAVTCLRLCQVDAHALTALVQVPLLEVCWQSVDCAVDRREALRDVAVTLGLKPGDPGSELLLRLLEASNAAEILAHWKQLIHALVGVLEPDALRALQWELTDRAWLMASTLHGADASRWPKPAFVALRELEGAFYESA